MCTVFLSGDNGFFKTCVVAHETPISVFQHYKIDTATKIIYMNGKLLSKEQAVLELPETGTVRFSFQSRTINSDR